MREPQDARAERAGRAGGEAPPRTGRGALSAERRQQIAGRLQEAARALDRAFLDKREIIRLLIISVIAGEHMVLVGPPGTAKSALVRTFARLVDARYFEYLLTRFTEPNELFGPVDMAAFRRGEYRRRTEGMLPEAEIVFLDEVFKANSAILNSLLTLLNERRFISGGQVLDCPLISVLAASNEVPGDDNLQAVFDRFLVRVRSQNLDSYHFHNLVTRGVDRELDQMAQREVTPVIDSPLLHRLSGACAATLNLSEELLATYKGLIFQIRSEGISISDRRVVKLTKLFAASALFDGREAPCEADLFVLRHTWNTVDQAEILDEIVSPVVDRYYRDHPEARRFAGPAAGLDEVLSELKLIRDLLTSGDDLSDIQLFSQLRNLNDIKAALQGMDGEAAREMVAQVDRLLDSVFASSRFG